MKEKRKKSSPANRGQPVLATQSLETTKQIQTLQKSLEQATRGQQMLLAFNQAAESILLAHTTEGVFQAILEQSSRQGYQATGLELTADGNLRIAFTGFKASLIRKAEKLTGVLQSDYRLSPRKDSIYHRVLFQGETICLQDTAQAIAEALPTKIHRLAWQIADLVGLTPTIISPLKIGGETLGILALTGPDLTETDNPLVAAFASQAAIAMQNARLCEAAQKDVAKCKQAEENLRKSEERYRLISNVASDYVFSTMVEEDGSLKLNWVAGAFEAITGYTFEDYVAHGGWRAMLHPDDQEIDDADLQTLHKNQKIISELRTLKKDGSIFWVRVYAHPVWDVRAERLTGIYGAVQNINEQKRAELLLRESEERYRSLFERMLDGVYRSTHEGKFVDVNPAMVKMFGYSSKEEMLEVDIKNELYFAPEERGSHILDTGQEEMDVYRMRRKNGSEIWVEDHGSYIHDKQGMIIYHEGMLRDITERKQAEEALRESEERFRKIFEEGSIGMVLTNHDLKFFSANPAFCQMLGYTVEEMNNKTFLDVTHPEHREADRVNVEKMWRGEIPQYRTQKRYIAKNGDIRWGSLSTSLIRGQDGKPLYALAMVEDITERKQAEAALSESEQRFRQLFVASPDALMLIDPYDSVVNWPIVDCNEIACQMNGYTREELIGKSIDILNATDSTLQERAAYLERIRSSGVFHLETFHRHHDGHIYPVEISTSIVKFKGRELILGIDRDITERKRAEEALATSEAELRALFASMQDVVLVIDQEGVYREIAPTDPGLLYKPAQELLGQNLRDVFSAEQVETFISVIRQTLDTGQTTRIEYELNISEHPIWFSTSISPMGADSTLWVAHDITEQKQAVNEIRRRAEEFAALYDTSMNLSAEHDLNTLLQTIVENAATMLHAYAGGMYLYDPVREELEVTFTTDPSMPVGTRLRLGEGVAGRVAKTRQSMRIDNYSTWDGRSKKYEGTAVRATIEVPMLYKGELIGVLVAHEAGASKRQYTKADEHLLSLFAFQAAAAIQNARLLEQERTRAKELSTLYEATKTISSDLDLESVLETVAEKMANISHSDGCTLSLLNHEQDTVTTLVDHRSKHPEHAESKDVIYYLKEYPASRHVLETGQPLTINIKDKEADQSELEHMTKRGITTLLMLPLIAHNQVIGLVEVYEEEGERAYEQEEIYLLQHLAAQAAISIENARLFEDAQRRLRQTTALREIDQAITGGVEIQHVLKVVLKHTISELDVDAAVILLYDPEEQSLHYEIGSGFLADSLQHTHLQIGQGYAGRAAAGKQTIYIPNLQVRNTDFLRSPTFHQEGFICYFGVPLIAKGEIMGVLEIFHRTPLNPDIEWLSFMETLAGQIAIAIDNATLYKNLQHSNEELSLAYDATIEGWSRALDLRDRETEGHTLRVTKLTVEMAAEMGLNKEELVHIRRGALLHDIGKMGVPDRILLKPDTLTDEEWKIMQKHPIFAYEMLEPIRFLLPALDIPYCHHERWDGTGYPRKLKGDDIPLVARIFAVVDVWDALTSNRPYRPAWTKEQALEHIQEQSGKHFDPKVVKVFLRLIAEE